MKWDLRASPRNRSRIRWHDAATEIHPERLYALTVMCPYPARLLRRFAAGMDMGHPWNSYRWYLVIYDVPDHVYVRHRNVQATLFAEDSTVLDGSTFGEVSVWEAHPEDPEYDKEDGKAMEGDPDAQRNRIVLVADFTKVRSQDHQFGLNVLVAAGVHISRADPEHPEDA